MLIDPSVEIVARHACAPRVRLCQPAWRECRRDWRSRGGNGVTERAIDAVWPRGVARSCLECRTGPVGDRLLGHVGGARRRLVIAIKCGIPDYMTRLEPRTYYRKCPKHQLVESGLGGGGLQP